MRFIINLLLIGCFGFNISAQTESKIDLQKNALQDKLNLHYKNDSLKLKAVAFLIDNLEIQHAENYRWIDDKNQKVAFDELNFDDYEASITGFKKLKENLKIRPQTFSQKDIETITPELLIKNIDLAFNSWQNNPWSKQYDFATFCEYILPYRSTIEPLEDWRDEYQFLVSKAANQTENKNSPADVASEVLLSLKNFKFLQSRPDPIPFLSPKQLLFRREGSCNDLANLGVLACRAVGLAATFDFTPFYGASSNKHFWNSIILENGKSVPFNGVDGNNPESLPYNYNPAQKRLAKVFRKTYSKQANALASTTEAKLIPPGFLKDKNILDVTHDYVTTATINYNPAQSNGETIAYINVFNLNNWRTVDWAKKSNNGFNFKNLGVNIVYLPSFYNPENQQMRYANYPILLKEENNQRELKPNNTKTFSFSVTRDLAKKRPTKDHNSFEVFENESFTLYVWDNGWKKVETGTSKNKAIPFTKMPDNGLFLLNCSKSNNYKRIFIINTEKGEIEWF